MLHCISQVISGAWFPPDVTLGIQAKEFIIGFTRAEILVSHGQSPLGAFWLTPSELSFSFYWEVASVWLLYHNSLIDGVLQRLVSFWKDLPTPQRNSVSDHRLLRHLPDQGPSPPIGSLGGSKLLSFKKATVFETFNAAEMFRYPSPDLCLHTILSRSSMDNSFDLMALFLLWHALSTVGPYIDRCVPFQIMSNQFNLPQVGSNQVVETSRMINGNRMHRSSISSLIAKGSNSYVNK